MSMGDLVNAKNVEDKYAAEHRKPFVGCSVSLLEHYLSIMAISTRESW